MNKEMNAYPQLSAEECQRYHRHILLPGVGEEGVQRLRAARVLVVGVGGLGSPVVLYLAAAGVGVLGLVDTDVVDVSNLQRQIIHTTRDVGRNKLHSAADKVRALNPDVKLEIHDVRLTAHNALSLVREYDFVIDAVDTWASKLEVNDACVAAGKPFCHAGVQGFAGQLMTHVPGAPCLRCVLGDALAADTHRAESGVPAVLGSLVGVLGSLQATEAIKFITGVGALCTHRLLVVDASAMTFETIQVQRNARCQSCGGWLDFASE